MRRVTVSWYRGSEKVRVGELAQRGSTIVFQWNDEFLNNQIELSPLSFKKIRGVQTCPANPFDGLPGVFADHVPDGWGKILIKRGFLEMGMSADDFSPLDMLTFVGDRAMGALTFEPSLKPHEKWASGKVHLSSLEQGAKKIIEGAASYVLNSFLESGASPNGIRPKIILKEKEGVFYAGNDALQADEWVIKFRGPEDSKDIGAIEYVYSMMASNAGLSVPESRLFNSKRNQLFGTKRFDRIRNERIHVHSLSGLLHTSPGNFSVGYETFSKVTRFLTKDERQVKEVFRLAVFNHVACNQDDHTKNVAFMMDKHGEWSLAPFYDLTFYQTRFNQHKMSYGSERELDFSSLKILGGSFGIRKSEVKLIIEQVMDAVSQFVKLSKDLVKNKNEIQRISAAINAKLRITTKS